MNALHQLRIALVVLLDLLRVLIVGRDLVEQLLEGDLPLFATIRPGAQGLPAGPAAQTGTVADPAGRALAEALVALDLDGMTPRAALELLYDWRARILEARTGAGEEER